MRIITAPIKPAKNTKLKIDKSKYNAILMIREKIHDTQLHAVHKQPHAVSQMAFSPIAFIAVKYGAYKGKQNPYLDCAIKNYSGFFVTLFIFSSLSLRG